MTVSIEMDTVEPMSGSPQPEVEELVPFEDGSEFLRELSERKEEYDVLLDRLVTQLEDEGKLAFPPLLCSLLKQSSELAEILQIWSQHRSLKSKISNLDRLIIVSLTNVLEQLKHRSDLVGIDGDSLSIASPLPLARVILNRHLGSLQFYLSTSATWIHSLVFRLLTAVNNSGLNIVKETVSLFSFKPSVLERNLSPQIPKQNVEGQEQDNQHIVKCQASRVAYLDFCLSFLDIDDEPTRTAFLGHQGLSFLTKELHLDSKETLSLLFRSITTLAQPSVRLTWSMLLSLIDLPLLTKCLNLLKSSHVSEDAELQAMICKFLEDVCTVPGTGICFKDGGWYSIGNKREKDNRPVNGLLFDFLSLLKPIEYKFHQTLALGIMKASPALASLFWTRCHLSFEPRLSSRWLGNMTLLQKVIQLPVPSLDAPRGSENEIPQLSLITEAVIPKIFDRAIQAKCLQSQIKLVRYFGSLCLLASLTKLSQILESIEWHIQEISSEQNILPWKKLHQEIGLEVKSRLADFRSVVSLQKSADMTTDSILSQLSSRILQAYQQYAPDVILQSGVGLDKLLPNNINTCHPAVQARSLELLLYLPDFKWWNQRVSSQTSTAVRLIQIYAEAQHPSLQSLASRALQKQLGSSVLFQHDSSELLVWLEAIKLHTANKSLYTLIDAALSLAMQSPYKFIDSVWSSSSSVRAPSWISDETVASQLPFSPMLLALRECLKETLTNSAFLNFQSDIVSTCVNFVIQLVFDLAIHSNSPEFLLVYVKDFIELLDSHVAPKDLQSSMKNCYDYLSSLFGLSPCASLPTASDELIVKFSNWSEAQFQEIDAQIDTFFALQPIDTVLGLLSACARFPGLTLKVRSLLLNYYSKYPQKVQMILTSSSLQVFTSTILFSVLGTLKLPLNFLVAMVHPSILCEPGLANILLDASSYSEFGKLFLARGLLFKLQLGLVQDGIIHFEETFYLLEEILNKSSKNPVSNSNVLSFLEHPLISHCFLNPDLFDNKNSYKFLRKFNIALVNLLVALPRATIPTYYITKIVVAIEHCLTGTSSYIPILTDLFGLLPKDTLESLTHKFLSRPIEDFLKNTALVLIVQGLVSTLSALKDVQDVIPRLSLTHLNTLIQIWETCPSIYMDGLLCQVVELQVPYANSFRYSSEKQSDLPSINHQYPETILSSKMQPMFWKIHEHLKEMPLSSTRVRIWSYLISSSRSLRKDFAGFVLKMPKFSLALSDPLLRTEVLSLSTTYLGLFLAQGDACENQESQAAILLSKSLITSLDELINSSETSQASSFSLSLALPCLNSLGWPTVLDLLKTVPQDKKYISLEYMSLCHVPSELRTELIDLLLSRLVAWKEEELRSLNNQDIKVMSSLLSDLTVNNDSVNEKITTPLLHALHAAVRLQSSDSLRLLHNALSRLGTNGTNEQLFKSAVDYILTIMINSDSEVPQSFKKACVDIIYELFKSNSALVCTLENLERLALIYNARYTTTDRQLLDMLMHFEVIHKTSVRQILLLWGSSRSRFSSLEIRELVLKGNIVHESLQNINPAMMRATIKAMPLPGLSLDPSNSLVSPPEFQELPETYDPAFLLPLISHWLSFGSNLSMVKFTHKHLLGFLISCLSSPDQQIRLAAYHLLDEVYIMIQSSKFNEKAQLLTLLEVTKDIIEDRSEYPRLPSVLTQFVAVSTSLVFQPTHPLYLLVNRFIVKYPILNTQRLPMFTEHFDSFSADSVAARPWLLTVFSKGLKTHKDHASYSRSNLFSYLMSYFINPAPGVRGPFEHQYPILEIFYHCSMSPTFAALLLGENGALDFLQGVCDDEWPLAPLVSLRLGLHLVLTSNIASLTKHLPSWPQSLLLLAYTGLSAASTNMLGAVEASLRISSFLIHYCLSHKIPITNNGPVSLSLLSTILDKSCELLEAMDLTDVTIPDTISDESSFKYNSYHKFADLASPPEDSQKYTCYVSSLKFGLELVGQVPCSHLGFLLTRALALGQNCQAYPNVAKDALNWVSKRP